MGLRSGDTYPSRSFRTDNCFNTFFFPHLHAGWKKKTSAARNRGTESLAYLSRVPGIAPRFHSLAQFRAHPFHTFRGAKIEFDPSREIADDCDREIFWPSTRSRTFLKEAQRRRGGRMLCAIIFGRRDVPRSTFTRSTTLFRLQMSGTTLGTQRYDNSTAAQNTRTLTLRSS